MRDFQRMDKHLDKLLLDIYPQPQDEGHTALASEFINTIMGMVENVASVLDLGCGEGFCQKIFEARGASYLGVCQGDDYVNAIKNGRAVAKLDYSFLPIRENVFDMLFSRHSLEHSPMPLLTLMDWHSITKRYLAVVLPVPSYWGYSGRNHYYVLNDLQWENLFDISGFSMIWKNTKSAHMAIEVEKPEEEIEYWYLLEKK